MYDAFSNDYDRFVNWESRLAVELPFIQQQLSPLRSPAGGPARVLDAACGTGMHALALARAGYEVAGADLSAGMVERAWANAARAGLNVRFKTAGFGQLEKTFGSNQFDALLCLGNSLPHLLTPTDLNATLADFAACLRPGGLLLIQNRNFDAVMNARERWMEPQSFREGQSEWIFLRFYDYLPDGQIIFNIVTLKRYEGSEWKQQVAASELRPQLQVELSAAVQQAGFATIQSYGAMSGAAFEPASSGNLILRAIRA